MLSTIAGRDPRIRNGPLLHFITEWLRHKPNPTLMRAVVFTLAAAVAAIFAAPGAALADEDYFKDCGYSNVSCQTGVQVGIPNGECMTASPAHHYTSVCVGYDGDYVYVKDGLDDGMAAMAFIRTDQGEVTGRHCRNNYGYGSWARCDFDWVESADKLVFGGYKEDYDYIFYWYLWEFRNK
jgi:hypothetical protein